MNRAILTMLFIGLLLAGCNQPFEPNGPPGNTLVVYGILNSMSDTQYVRLSTTFASPPEPALRNASVTLTANTGSSPRGFTFRDTTVLWSDSAGNPVPTNVYVAYNAPVRGNIAYQLQVSAPSGLSASSSVTALPLPFFGLKPGATPGFFVLTRTFNSQAGAAILHFYLDYYVLVNNGWLLQSEEVPQSRSQDAAGNDVLGYPSITPTATLAAGGNEVSIDSTLFQITRVRVYKKYQPAPVVYLDIRFVLTQIDDALYDYYYLNNGPVDNSSIRLDVPDFTNIRGGLGVFGSRTEVVLLYPLAR